MVNKIKLTCSWCEDDVLYERFIRTYVSQLNYNSEYVFTNNEDYDWLVIINHPRYEINFPKEKTIGVIMEPSWTKHYELRFLLEQRCKYILSHKKENNPQYIFYPGLLPFHLDYNEGNNLDYFLNTTFEKSRLCSFIVSYNDTNPHTNCLYRQRVNFAKQILNSNLDIDIYGNGWENCPIKDLRIKGSLKNKIDGLADYSFSIAIENCVENGYFTEKITDCFLTGTTPIYFGCSDIQNYFKEVQILPSLDNIKHLLPLLNKTNQLHINKNVLATKYNLYAALVKYINNQNK